MHYVTRHKHSYLFEATETILAERDEVDLSEPRSERRSRRPTLNLFQMIAQSCAPPPESLPPKRRVKPRLLPSALLRSSTYTTQLTDHLRAQYPHIPRHQLGGIARTAGSYGAARAAAEAFRPSKLATLLESWFGGKANNSKAQEVILDRELLDEIRAYELPDRIEQEQRDAQVARELNALWVKDTELYECGCCYASDLTFEDIVTCANDDPHVFCRACVTRQVEQHVHGGAVLPVEGTIRCLSIDECDRGFSEQELERVLDRRLYLGLERRRADAAIAAVPDIVRCPFCPFAAEIVDVRTSTLRAAFALGSRRPKSVHAWAGAIVQSVILAPVALSVLFVITLVVVFVIPECFTVSDDDDTALFPLLEPIRAARAAISYLATSIERVTHTKRGGAPLRVLRCHNTPTGQPVPSVFGNEADGVQSRQELVRRVWPCVNNTGDESTADKEWCGRVSCATCQLELSVEGFELNLSPRKDDQGLRHVCLGDEWDGLRLLEERARSQAVERRCGSCRVRFVKEAGGGCNKVSRPDGLESKPGTESEVTLVILFSCARWCADVVRQRAGFAAKRFRRKKVTVTSVNTFKP